MADEYATPQNYRKLPDKVAAYISSVSPGLSPGGISRTWRNLRPDEASALLHIRRRGGVFSLVGNNQYTMDAIGEITNRALTRGGYPYVSPPSATLMDNVRNLVSAGADRVKAGLFGEETPVPIVRRKKRPPSPGADVAPRRLDMGDATPIPRPAAGADIDVLGELLSPGPPVSGADRNLLADMDVLPWLSPGPPVPDPDPGTPLALRVFREQQEAFNGNGNPLDADEPPPLIPMFDAPAPVTPMPAAVDPNDERSIFFEYPPQDVAPGAPPPQGVAPGADAHARAAGIQKATGVAAVVGNTMKTVAQSYNMDSKNPDLSVGQKVTRGVGRAAASGALGAAGAVQGAAAGTAACGILGTVAGGIATALGGPLGPGVGAGAMTVCNALAPIVGAAVGGLAGSETGAYIANTGINAKDEYDENAARAASVADDILKKTHDAEEGQMKPRPQPGDDGDPDVDPGGPEVEARPPGWSVNDEFAGATAAATDADPPPPRGQVDTDEKPRLGPDAYPNKIPAVAAETLVGKEAAGDFFLNNPTLDHAAPVMRSDYKLGTGADVIPSSRKQLESDIRFDMFDDVLEGYGNGADNKLFLMQEARDKRIIGQAPMMGPGQWTGPTNGVTVGSWKHQRVIPQELIAEHGRGKLQVLQRGVAVRRALGVSSLSQLGDDVGYPHNYSSKGLKRKGRSPLEPVIRTDFNWEHVKPPTGAELNRKKFRLETDGQREPEKLISNTRLMGGPTLSRRHGLEAILQ